MKEMTDEEAEYLDELWTRTTPEIDMTRPGYFARKQLALSDENNYHYDASYKLNNLKLTPA
jgi:hypothetical protein